MTNAKPMTILRKLTPALLLTLCALMPSLPTMAEEADEETEVKGVTDYIAMEPAFVTHVGKPDAKVAYLKASVTIRASRETTRPAVEAHMPRLRHELVMLFGEQTDLDQLSSMDGQQALREEATKRINGVLFTEFVVQR